ncbi:hypothetical protein Q3G72_031265 [Acer saccharum]|nr:hypothetical protein Q3G72_031265 [Acer saccharum]
MEEAASNLGNFFIFRTLVLCNSSSSIAVSRFFLEKLRFYYSREQIFLSIDSIHFSKVYQFERKFIICLGVFNL